MENQNDGEAVERCIFSCKRLQGWRAICSSNAYKVKVNKPEYKLKKSPVAPEMKGDLSITVRVVNKEGKLVSEFNELQNVNNEYIYRCFERYKTTGSI